ncbi:hypothetical protein AVEN_193866-1 [Araneus ventricosus]|uniref:Uncharacterized protein n=1 Tax=Araneus ventricosus TaxID=182803 RepID=A0A4Y2TZS0_ARAVE|nr:hypothetical protein AVEN_193866-1 [Araneus ventricosus]
MSRTLPTYLERLREETYFFRQQMATQKLRFKNDHRWRMETSVDTTYVTGGGVLTFGSVIAAQGFQPLPRVETTPEFIDREPFLLGYVPQHRTLKLQHTGQKKSTTSRDKHTDKNDREASWEKDGSSSATYHRKEKAVDCNRYIFKFQDIGKMLNKCNRAEFE